MVGVVAVYSYIQQATETLPGNVFELLLGNVGTLVLSLIIGYWLYRANQRKEERIERQQAALIDEKERENERERVSNDFLRAENARLWQEIHEIKK